MGASKSDFFSDYQNQIATLAKALAHPARIAIIEYLIKVNSCVCSDIVTELPLAQPTISQHLKELKNAGIIKGSIDGNSVCYCLDREMLDKIELFINKAKKACPSATGECC